MPKKPTLAELLSTYGITCPADLHRILRKPPYGIRNAEYARKLYRGRHPVSRKVALAIRDHTGGALTFDALMAQNGR